MIDIPSSPPVILPLPPDELRPLWSVMIPVYNCAEYLPETLKSVLKQDIPAEQMQIEVVDDGSTDADVEAIVKRVGKGRAQYFRQNRNVGSLRNFETCINRAKGKLIHMLHGDDLVSDGYYKAIGRLFELHPDAGAAFCRYNWINNEGDSIHVEAAEEETAGILENGLLRLAERNVIQCAAVTVRRDVYEKLGSFYGVTYGEDWEMWVRIARNYPIAYTPEILASYRKHTSSISGQKYYSGQHLRDILQVMNTIQQHLPAEQKQQLLKRSKRFYAHHGVRLANQIWHSTHDKRNVREQLKLSLHLHKSPQLYWKTTLLYLKMMLNRK